ncbi:sugar 3,4-ketoisomerase [Clostridium frigidicarnis]|uniref:WxcM-like, C-terminal n=1 Tax=Clostridium frigidicarnis TaxID=84698 RepID=A0A1I0X9N8_9CLOT|nr:FdtA/QdtA family cupin domain-containing protein [Clostridium frigidicarnis]SFA97028.1 WxcM-like, C-terminal [Clostridium frigidicarnis]
MDIKLYNFKEIGDYRGVLVPIEQLKNIPFEIKRIYYMYDTKKEIVRGKHAHKTLQQILICINGQCKVLLDDGKEKSVVNLDRRNLGLYIGPNTWREMFEFSEEAVLVVLASDYYKEEDYIRDYNKFLESVN